MGTADDKLALLDLWAGGETAAGNELFRRHFAALYRFFHHKTAADGDELVQETFLQCVKARDRFQRHSSSRTFLFAIARNILFAHGRKRATAPATLDFEDMSLAAHSASAGTRLSRRDERDRLMSALSELPLDQQLLLELYYWQELDRDQLAEVLDVEAATLGSRLFRARQALAERMR